ncbi:MAG: ribulose phosphate epimerase [Deltaproteobacteria bacterium]|nr:ribulose phosphate epimerase [Nannocystaceae bacterium]
MRSKWMKLVWSSALVIGCGTKSEGEGTATADDTSSGTSSTGNDDEAIDEASQSGPITTAPGTGETGVEDTSGGVSSTVGFIMNPDGGSVTNECDIWAQDCPVGEKCMPWANDGGNAWNATRCAPVESNPGQVGDECTVEGSGVSGIDTCDLSQMCYYVDPDTNLGICVGFCQGSSASPVCDPGYVCTINNDGVLILCRPECDPLLQDCMEAVSCLPAAGSDQFTCIVDASGEEGAAGDACEFVNACDPGLFCGDATAVPDCAGASGCCTEFCDLADPGGAAQCSLGGGQECVPWFEEGNAPPGLEDVGACALPA